MSPAKKTLINSKQLRRQAEEAALNETGPDSLHIDEMSKSEIRAVLHDLQVHQIELQIQNEELRRSQIELEDARSRYFDLYDLAPVGYCTLNSKGIILEANLTTAAMLAVPRSSLKNKRFSQFIHPEDQDIFYFHQSTLLKDGITAVQELRMRKADSTLIWVQLTTTSVTDENDTPVFRIILSDITRHIESEQENIRLSMKLNQAQKMESIGRLAGGVAHDFNNMLGVIIGHCELAMDTLGSQNSSYPNLEEIYHAANRSAKLTRQLLAFASKQIIQPKVINLNDLISNIMKMLQRLIGEHISIDWQPSADIWPLRLDPSQIDQILTNLCVNSRDAIQGNGKITISTDISVFDEAFCLEHSDYIPGEYVHLLFKDNGSGMSEEVLANIFEPFYTTKELGKGTGLGLAMIYGIIKQNHGMIFVNSIINQGTAFDIFLPRFTGNLHETLIPTEPDPVLDGNEVILVVEDEKTIINLIEIMLNRLGYKVFCATTPAEALAIAEKHHGRINLLITDIIMPQLNGFELSQRLTEINRNMKCLFMSGYTADIISEYGVLTDNLYFIQKPFLLKELTAKIRHILNSV
jgi:two-component system cell cycle sensor histidine kinase/response regulator CckA